MLGSGLEPGPHLARGTASMGGAGGFWTGTEFGVWPPPWPSAARSLSGPNGPAARLEAGTRASAAVARASARHRRAVMHPFFPATLPSMPNEEREDLKELLARRALTLDEARPDAVEKRHERGGRTARENLDDLVDPGSLVEYGRFAIAAQRQRRELEDLIERTPAD